MTQIPLQAVPSQQLQTVVGNQNVQLAIYQKDQGLFVDVSSNGVDISTAVIALDMVALTWNYSGFVGNFVIVDTVGNDEPDYTGLGSRFQLVYLTTDEYEQLQQ